MIPSRKRYLREQFDKLDDNGSRKLSAKEVTDFIMEECHVDENTARSLMEDFDCDDDGQLRRQEFEKLMEMLAG